MPYSFNDARRDKIPKTKYRVSNWSAYNESLRRRGDLTVWVADDVAQNWVARRRKTRGGQARYSNLAIEICLTLRTIFRLALRQTQGFMRSIWDGRGATLQLGQRTVGARKRGSVPAGGEILR